MSEQAEYIQWRGSNIRECREWLGSSFGYKAGLIYFDQGLIVRSGEGTIGDYGDWFLRGPDGSLALLEGELAQTDPPAQPTPAEGETDVVDGGMWLASKLRTEGQRERAMLVEGLYDEIRRLRASRSEQGETERAGVGSSARRDVRGVP
jgi:hypothetical protein